MSKFNKDMAYMGTIYITDEQEREAADPVVLRQQLLLEALEATGIPAELHNRIFISATKVKPHDGKAPYTKMRWNYIPDPGVYNLEEGVTP